MPSRTATVSTTRVGRYLQQLCKFFGHKVPVNFTPEPGRITLSIGTCGLTAEGDTLTLDVVGEVDKTERLQGAIGDHFARFAFRENLELHWPPDVTASPGRHLDT